MDNDVVRLPDIIEVLQSDSDIDGEPLRGNEERFKSAPKESKDLIKFTDEEAKKWIPKDKNGEPHLSIGSQHHENGTCRPCAFFSVGNSCKNGIRCYFCHHFHSVARRERLCKKKRVMLKKMKEEVQAELSETTTPSVDTYTGSETIPAVGTSETIPAFNTSENILAVDTSSDMCIRSV